MSNHVHSIIHLLRSLQWISPEAEAEFLASGEYHQNFLITDTDQCYVFRINLGTQINRHDQIYYEYRILQHLQKSTRTPHPLGVIWPQQEGSFFVQWKSSPPSVYTEVPFSRGALLAGFLPGCHLEYAHHSLLAADTLARIHSLPLPSEPHIIIQKNPVHALCEESRRLLFHDLPEYRDTRQQLLQLSEQLSSRGLSTRECVVNTEVNNENFLVHENIAYLVDWEKAVITHPAVDLAHFLLPTTTRWKTAYTFSSEERKQFLQRYCSQTTTMSKEELDLALSVLEPAALLRALSWCYHAWHTHTLGERPIPHKQSLRRMKEYLQETPQLIRHVCQ